VIVAKYAFVNYIVARTCWVGFL